MRLLHLSDRLTDRGGAYWHMLGLLEALRDLGHEVQLAVGRFSASKGPLEALQAWRLSGLDLPLLVAGTGPLRPSLERQGARVLGWVDRPRLSALYRRARAVLMPSREWHPGRGLVPWGDVASLARALREAVGLRALPPSGFEREALTRRLIAEYEAALAAGRQRLPSPGPAPTEARGREGGRSLLT